MMQDGRLLCLAKCVDGTQSLTMDQRRAEFLANMGPDAANEVAPRRGQPNLVKGNF